MNLDRAVLAFAGLVVLISLALGYWVSPYWFLLTAFAGLNWRQPVSAKLYRFLSGRTGLQGYRHTERQRLQITSERFEFDLGSTAHHKGDVRRQLSH